MDAIGKGGRGGLVDNVQDFQPRQPAGIDRRLPPGLVEVSGDRDHRLAEFSQLQQGILPKLAKDQGLDQFGRQSLAANRLMVVALAHVPLGELREGFRFIPPDLHCLFADDHARLVKINHARRGQIAV